MRELLSAAVTAVLLSTTACTAERSAPEKAALVIPDGWSPMYSPKGGFRAAFPFRPMVKESPLKTEAGWVRVLSYLPLKNGSSGLSVIMEEYPDGTMSRRPAEEVLKRAGDRVLAQHQLTLVTDKPVKVDGPEGGDERSFPGRDLEAIQESEGRRVSLRIILVKDRVYQIMYMHKDEKTETFKQFLSTFALHSFGPVREFLCCEAGSAD